MSQHPHVVFLANDAVFKQGLAFLESLRVHNPTLKLSMIPFADDIHNFERLQEIYEFDILRFDVTRWDDLAREFFPGASQKYRNRLRKLSIFDVQSPATIYLDLDMIVLRDLNFLVKPITSGEADFICTATSNDPWVYNPSYKDHPVLQQARRFSDGFFTFNSAKISADIAYTTVVNNKGLYLSVRADQVYCQPITNFIVDMLGLKIREVFRLFPNISPQVWYAGQQLQWTGDHVASNDGKEVLFIHWAGPLDMSTDFRFRELFEIYLERARIRAAAAGIEQG